MTQENETRKHILEVNKNISLVIKDLLYRAVNHDSSKLESPEKEIFEIFTSKLKGTTYGSDEYNKYLKEMKVALDSHYNNNKHHPEYYTNGIKDMSLIDIMEMLCDWKAATMRHADGDILKSVEINQKRFGYSDELKQILLNTLAHLDILTMSERYKGNDE